MRSTWKACSSPSARPASTWSSAPGKGDAGGSLVGIASLAGHRRRARATRPMPATKGAVIVDDARPSPWSMRRYGMRANAIAPGWIATDMTAGAQGSDVFNDKVITARADPPLGRAGGLRRHRRLSRVATPRTTTPATPS